MMVVSEDILRLARRHEHKVPEFRYREEKLITGYIKRRLFSQDPFSGMSREARAEGGLIRKIAEASGFKVLAANSSNGCFKNILFGDIHFMRGDKEWLMYHRDIAEIVLGLAEKGVLKERDFVCSETYTGELDYNESNVAEGNTHLVIYDWKRGKRITILIDEGHFAVKAFDGLRKNRLRLMFDDSKEISDMRRELSAEYSRSIETPQARYLGMMMDALLYARMEDGALRFLRERQERCAQVFGLRDLIAAQEELPSFISLIPADPIPYLNRLMRG
jgi:hypothetical protein